MADIHVLLDKLEPPNLRLLFDRIYHGAYFVAHIFLVYGAKFLFLGNQHDAAFQNFSAVECGTINCSRSLQLPVSLGNYQRTST